MEDKATQIKAWGKALGFDDVRIGRISEPTDERLARLTDWLAAGFHGEMTFMARNPERRARAASLLPEALSIIHVSLPYAPPSSQSPDRHMARIGSYARGEDYHVRIKRLLGSLVEQIEEAFGPVPHRICCDASPLSEVELAEAAGLGWRGKNTLLLRRHENKRGSWFFLGEVLVGLALPADPPTSAHCGSCSRCLDLCPTRAFVAPFVLDARRCISYLTIEHKGSIPEELRPLMGNHVFGCDICQQVCPWNEADSEVGWTDEKLAHLFLQNEQEFLAWAEGTVFKRLGHIRWLRNLAVALGNASPSAQIHQVLLTHCHHSSPLVREHVEWALLRHSFIEQTI